MRKDALRLVAALAGCCISAVYGDATLVYELGGPDSPKAEKAFSVARFWVRVDDPAEKDQYLLFQAGKFFPMYRVEPTAQTYTRLTPEVTPTLHAGSGKKPEAAGEEQPQGRVASDAQANREQETEERAAQPATPEQPGKRAAEVVEQATPDAPDAGDEPPMTPEQPQSPDKATSAATQPAEKTAASPQFKPTKKMGTVAGIKCRVVLELGKDDKPAKEHCMANTGHLGLTEREVITVARLFAAAREMGFDWLGVSTKDERFVSVQTRDLASNRTLQLKSVSTKPLPKGHLRVPKSFKEVKPEEQPQPADPEGATDS
jgi:hypothetical protein